ncbi:hypothetical protein FRC02_005879 [Tulasnella sp. 418]|nr:hypothetical protein FRC02_005879 [Tulasnella sp. 418]
MATELAQTGRTASAEGHMSDGRRNSLELLAEIALASSPTSSPHSLRSTSGLQRATFEGQSTSEQPPIISKCIPEVESAISTEDSEETAISSISSPVSLSCEPILTRDVDKSASTVHLLEDGIDRISQIKESFFSQTADTPSMAAYYISRQELHCLAQLSSPTALQHSNSHSSKEHENVVLGKRARPNRASSPPAKIRVKKSQDPDRTSQDTTSRSEVIVTRGIPSPITQSSVLVAKGSGSKRNTTFIQERRCIRIKTKHNKCVSCNKRKKGDTCRFLGIRTFPGGTSTEPIGKPSLVSDSRPSKEVNYPTSWNVDMDNEAALRVMSVISRSLLGILQEELNHLARPGIIVRNRELEFRVTCDCCMTSIFTACWICQDCGREICADCHLQVSYTTEHLSDAEAKARRRSPMKSLSESEGKIKRLMACSFKDEHTISKFLPVSRFSKEELEELIGDMKKMEIDEAAQRSLLTGSNDTSYPEMPSPTAHIAATDPVDPSGVGSHPVYVFPSDALDENAFKLLWAKGQAIVVTGLLSKFELSWNPEKFIEDYGSQQCEVVECRTNQVKLTHVGAFFKKFGQFDERKECLKLKDWPPTAEFSKEFPELYSDFARAVPVPNYTRRDGILNLAAHFPTNADAVVPDIGPKMYNAFMSSELPGGNGSTRLHMDMADAVNIMMFASPLNDDKSTPGVAVWDIYRAEDTSKLRHFLTSKFGISSTDPVHSQEYYLDSELRKELWETQGIKSWRIYQKPGEAVFIPAGCAHQVCNLSDCIKVAVDFVSPENVDRCEVLTKEFREQNQSHAWKEDVLQLKMTMYHAWKSLSRFPRFRTPEEGVKDCIMTDAR